MLRAVLFRVQGGTFVVLLKCCCLNLDCESLLCVLSMNLAGVCSCLWVNGICVWVCSSGWCVALNHSCHSGSDWSLFSKAVVFYSGLML